MKQVFIRKIIKAQKTLVQTQVCFINVMVSKLNYTENVVHINGTQIRINQWEERTIYIFTTCSKKTSYVQSQARTMNFH
jgi:hypothetical protein